jgi:hypothetical protein
MRSLLAVTLLATAVLIGIATSHLVTREAPRDCLPPSARSIENLFAPCLARQRQEEIETTGQR